ncbi:hypothetical protein [Curtobacterium sp. L1-20]|uniref:hypothetical protein n=1 Tax=Curtobacterium sp. L1-20 TaxID=3138181 RepID=UPI003B5249FD
MQTTDHATTTSGTTGRRAVLQSAAAMLLGGAFAIAGAGGASATQTGPLAATHSRRAGSPVRFGVGGHHPWIDGFSYPAADVVQQLQLARVFGCTAYRLDWFVPLTMSARWDWRWYDTVVDTAEQLGLELLCVLTPEGGYRRSYGSLVDNTVPVVQRYAGRIPWFQLANELDNVAIKSGVDGSRIDHFDTEAYPMVRNVQSALRDGVRLGDPTARTIANVAWKHTGFLERAHRDGLLWDVNSLNWYAHTEQNHLTGDDQLLAVLDRIGALPQGEVLITELNLEGGAATDRAALGAQARRLEETLVALRDRGPRTLTHVFLYELLDQPTAGPGQDRYGLVPVDRATGLWGAQRPVAATFAAHAVGD